METFVQKDGLAKGAEVEVVSEDGSLLTIRNITTGFVYNVSLKIFQQHYKAKENAKN